MEGQKPGPVCMAHRRDFAKRKDLQTKIYEVFPKCLDWETW